MGNLILIFGIIIGGDFAVAMCIFVIMEAIARTFLFVDETRIYMIIIAECFVRMITYASMLVSFVVLSAFVSYAFQVGRKKENYSSL